MNKKDKYSNSNLVNQESVQQVLPIRDIENGFIKVKNYSSIEYFPVIAFGDINIDLMSVDKKYELGKRIETALASISVPEFQILLVPTVYNITEWKEYIDRRLIEIHDKREQLLIKIRDLSLQGEDTSQLENEKSSLEFYEKHMKGQMAYVTDRLSSGTFVSERAYFIPHFNELPSLEKYQEATDNLVHHLNEHIAGTYQCKPAEVKNIVLFSVLNPMRKDYIDCASTDLPPYYSKH